jgi:hypothetical protein
LSAIEFGAAGQLDAAGSQDVPPPFEIYVVGLSCIVVSVELAEVLQLPEVARLKQVLDDDRSRVAWFGRVATGMVRCAGRHGSNGRKNGGRCKLAEAPSWEFGYHSLD